MGSPLATIQKKMSLFNFLKKKDQQESKRTPDNPYREMRSLALSMTPDQFGLALGQEELIIFGVIVEIGFEEETVTLCTFISGDTSVYFSNGSGIIGAGQNEHVSNLSKKVIQSAYTLAGKGYKIVNVTLPEKRDVNFVLLTNRGTEIITDHISGLMNGQSPNSIFFALTDALMTEIRSQNQA